MQSPIQGWTGVIRSKLWRCMCGINSVSEEDVCVIHETQWNIFAQLFCTQIIVSHFLSLQKPWHYNAPNTHTHRSVCRWEWDEVWMSIGKLFTHSSLVLLSSVYATPIWDGTPTGQADLGESDRLVYQACITRMFNSDWWREREMVEGHLEQSITSNWKSDPLLVVRLHCR